MISMLGGHFVPIPFAQMIDPATGRTRVRLADVTSTGYAIARRYMIRLRRDDLADPRKLARLAGAVKLSPEAFRQEFQGLVANEPPPLVLRDTVRM
jgi:6-phosphofructokinase 1